MPTCIINQNTGSVGFACHVVPNMTNAIIAIHPNKPISNAESERVSALIESARPSLNDTLRISEMARYWKKIPRSHATVKSRINAVTRTDPKIMILLIKISQVLITSPIVHPAPQWVAETNMLSQNGLPDLLVVYSCDFIKCYWLLVDLREYVWPKCQ